MPLRLGLQLDSNHSEQGSILARLIAAARCSVASPFRERESARAKPWTHSLQKFDRGSSKKKNGTGNLRDNDATKLWDPG
jgi:hypothetical protein